ncbi:MAG: VanW family protein [Clostridiales bacterium]|nr:VanW family protein [Clostridiales bacterium]
MGRKLFCQISPTTYKISVQKCRLQRHIKDLFSRQVFASKKTDKPLPIVIYRHKSLIRRRLGNVHMDLQENKAVNLSLAAPKVTGILIRPGETFSFWHLVGSLSARKGYLEGLAISNGQPKAGTGGGMCQFTNLIHWMILHTPLKIVEHHHHDGMDLFPDFNRQIPFGTGTSIVYNYLDYRFYNPTDTTYQLIVYTTPAYLCGELRATKPQKYTYHIVAENEHFEEHRGVVYRCGEVYRRIIDPRTGNCIKKQLIRRNHAKVMYDTSHLHPIHIP